MDSAKDKRTSYLGARVTVWWLPGHALWWNTELLGTTAQLAAALEELATRITVDSLARQVLSTDSFSVIGYGLAFSRRAATLRHHGDTVLLRVLPERLRSHAEEIRAANLGEFPCHGHDDTTTS
ncbi:hypothetical protein ACWEKT_37370 [Nocardia takedensis]